MTISIETGNAGTYPDVDETQLLDLCERLPDGMEFLIVHDSARNEHAQAARTIDPETKEPVPGSYVIEYCTADRHHYQAKVSTTAEVGAFLAGWAWQRDGWNEGYAWTELEQLRGV